MDNIKIHIDVLRDSIIPKLLNFIQDKEKQKKLKFYLHSKFPKSLGYKTKEDFLNDNNLEEIYIIKNSIKYSLKDADDYVLTYLSIEFSNLSSNYKIIILNDDIKNAVYLEIIEILEYIKQVQSIFTKSLKRTDYLGTANRSSSFKKRVTSQLKMLIDRLEHPFFPITCEFEKEKTNFQIKVLESVLDDKRIIETLNYNKLLFGLDNKFYVLSDIEKVAFDELLNFLNGLRSDSSRLINSVMFFINNISNSQYKNLGRDYVDSVDTIVNHFFSNEIEDYNKQHSNYLQFTRKKMMQETTIATILYETIIYTSKTSNNGVIEFFQEEGIKDLFGFKNIFDESKPEENEQTKYQELKSIAIFKKEVGFTKIEMEAFSYLIEQIK